MPLIKNKLTTLILITSAAMIGIIALQLFWLYDLYGQQRDRFRADVENALVETLFTSSIGKPSDSTGVALIVRDDNVSATMMKDSAGRKFGSTGGVRGITTVEMISDTAGLTKAYIDSVITKVKDQIIGRLAEGSPLASKGKSRQQQLQEYKVKFSEALRERKIELAPELAITDANDSILAATTDPETFAGISFKIKDRVTKAMNTVVSGDSLVAAFPGHNTYLLRRMMWILVLSFVLAVICSGSFIYTVSLFFRQKKMSEIRNDFMNNMTHELKTPISSISVALELVQDQSEPMTEEAKAEYFSIARDELGRLTMLVDKVLKMAAFDRAAIQINPEPVSARVLADNVVNAFRPVFEKRQVSVSLIVDPEDLVIIADKVHMTNLLQNLVDNALRYNDKLEATISIAIREKEGQVVIQVADNGKGIPDAYANKVFDKFFRVPSGDLHNIKGYGLGLSYVKAIAELHGGSVSLKSRLHEGSTFTVRFPKTRTDA